MRSSAHDWSMAREALAPAEATRDYLNQVLKKTGWSGAELARRIEKPASTINRPLKPTWKYGLSLPTLRAVASKSGVALPPTLTGADFEAAPGSTMEMIPERNVRAAAGGGSFNDGEEIIGEWGMPTSYVRNELRAKAPDLDIITIESDSMEPTLSPGDRIVVDRSRRAPSPPGVFVIWDGIALVAKRIEYLEELEPPVIRLASDNNKYRAYERAPEEVNIVGRVIAMVRRMS